NVAFKDVRTVMNDSGVAIMGNAVAEGEDRALRAVEGALASPLLKDNEIEGARYILLNITSGKQEVTMDEVTIITDYIQDKAGLSADLIWGNCINESFESELSVTIIATGFQTLEERIKEKENERIEIPLTPEEPKIPYVRPINQFVRKDNDAPEVAGPVLKSVAEPSNPRTVPQQADLFSATSPNKPQLRNNTPDKDGIIRHTLTPESEQPSPADEVEDDGYEVKTRPSAFHFELPTDFGEEMPANATEAGDNSVEYSQEHVP